MADAAIAVIAVLLLGAAVVALRAVLDGRRTGLPASIAVLAPLAEGARLLRTRAVGAHPGARPLAAGALLLLAPLVRAVLLHLDLPGGVAWLVAAEVLWCVGAGLLGRWRTVVLELPLLVALVTPVVAAGSLRVGAPQQDLPFAAEAPVAFVLLLVVGAVLLPWAVHGPVERLGGGARLLAGAGRAMQPVSIAATAAVLLLGTAGAWTWLAAAVLAALLVTAARRFPVLPMRRLVRLALAVLLPLAVVQLGVVVALTLLA